MSVFRTVPIRKQVRRLILLTSIVGAALACGAFVVHGVISSHSTSTRELSELTRVAGINCAVALASTDHEEARDRLTPLLEDPRITGVHLFNRAGELFVELDREELPGGVDSRDYRQEGTYQIGNLTIITRPIQQAGRSIGTIIVEAEIAPPLVRSAPYWPIGLGIAVMMLAVSFVLSFVLEPIITKPILLLTQDADRALVQAGRPVAGLSKSSGEIGQLMVRFSELKAIIEEKNDLLAEMDDLMEQRVEERTLELKTQVEHRHQVEERLRESLKDKELLLKEIHHRVKNNLQIISSLLDLQARNVKDHLAHASLKTSQNRVHSVALVHEMFYQSDDLGRIELASYVRRISSYLVSAYESEPEAIQVQLSSTPVSIGIDQAIPLGLIIHELVSNAIKYAFPHQSHGEILINLRPHNDTVRLEITDNGIGLPDAAVWEQPTTLGMQLVHGLSQQLGGSIELLGNGGTTFVLSFPFQPDVEKG